MGISQALYTGVTGLSVNSDGMSVIANNIANANARGFKYDRAEFEDLLSVDLGSGSNSSQLGRGCRLRDVKTIHTQGGLAVTDNLTDLAIQGNGLFVVSNPNTESQESGGQFFTRVGSFAFDRDGYLVDSVGGRIQGYQADQDGLLSTRVSDIRLVTNNLPPVATKKVMMNVNLDSRADVLESEFDVNRAEKTSNFNNTITVFDSQGRGHNMTIYYNRLEASSGESKWAWRACVDSKDVVDGDTDVPLHEVAAGELTFNSLGNLLSEETFKNEVSFKGGALPNQEIELDFGQNIGIEGGNGVGTSSSVAAESVTVFHNQNGFEAGNLKSLKIELDGTIRGYYTNGIQRQLASLAIATFENIDGLQKAGRNQFFKTLESGPPRIGRPQTGTRGSIYASSLEESNVDLATQFVNMIMTQRGFQANSRSITTTDSMIEEVVNLKR